MSLVNALVLALAVWHAPTGPVLHKSIRAQGDGYVERVARHMQLASDLTGIDVATIAAVGVVESGLDPNAVSTIGAVGPMQLFRRAKKEWRAVCRLSPDECEASQYIIGARVIARGVERCGSIGGALSLYRGTGSCRIDDRTRHTLSVARRIRASMAGAQ